MRIRVNNFVITTKTGIAEDTQVLDIIMITIDHRNHMNTLRLVHQQNQALKDHLSTTARSTNKQHHHHPLTPRYPHQMNHKNRFNTNRSRPHTRLIRRRKIKTKTPDIQQNNSDTNVQTSPRKTKTTGKQSNNAPPSSSPSFSSRQSGCTKFAIEEDDNKGNV